MTWWWLSFADNRGVIGCAITQGFTPEEAFAAATYLDGVPADRNAGTVETALWPIPTEVGEPPTGYAGRVLTTDEADAMWAAWCPSEPRCGLLSDLQAELDTERACSPRSLTASAQTTCGRKSTRRLESTGC